mgnify:FL=1
MMYAIIRAVVALGFGVVTYGAVLYALNRAINEARISYNSLPGELLNFLAIAGVPEVMGILLGAVVAAASLRFAKRIAFIGG